VVPDPPQEFEHAARAYGRTLGGAAVSPWEREDAARDFLAAAARFWVGGADALDFACRSLGGLRVATASRLLLVAADPSAQERLVEVYLGPQPTARARTLLASTLTGGSPDETCAAVRAAALWGDAELLRSWIHAPGVPRPHQFEAAVQLALGQPGRQPDWGRAVEWLEEIARGAGSWAVEACRRLCHLALPQAVGAMAHQLRSGADDDVSLVLEPVRLLGAMAIGPVLLERLESEMNRRQGERRESLVDALVTGLGDLTGAELPDRLPASPSVDADGSLASGRRAIPFYMEQLKRFDPRLRYWGAPPNRLQHEARPVTLDILIDALGDWGNPAYAETAANQLRAMTGEHHGFDSDYDLIANLAAVEAWRARAQTPLPVEPGGWMHQGRPVAPPSAPWSTRLAQGSAIH
jgi:hypothetical protein